MANSIRVNTISLNNTKQEIRAELVKIRTEIGQITSDMEALNAMWDGEAHTAFVNCAADDLRQLEEVCEGLRAIIDYQDTAVNEYKDCEQQISEMILQIR